jgi:hypothetical protein
MRMAPTSFMIGALSVMCVYSELSCLCSNGTTGRLGCVDPPMVTRSLSWIFRCKPLISNDRILARLRNFP